MKDTPYNNTHTAVAVNYAAKNKNKVHFPFAGESQSFKVKFKHVEDYPIDLYHLMDVSFSMKDDLPHVKNLGVDEKYHQ